MPVYEYQCGACGHQFEEWQKITAEPVRTCPSCSKKKVERLISMTSFQLKGGGWYSDLYASANGRAKGSEGADKAVKTDKADKSAGEAKAQSKSDTTKAKDSPKESSAKKKSDSAATGAAQATGHGGRQ